MFHASSIFGSEFALSTQVKIMIFGVHFVKSDAIRERCFFKGSISFYNAVFLWIQFC